MRNEKDFAEFKYGIFKNGTPKPQELAKKYAWFRDTGEGADEEVTKKINTELLNLLNKYPEEATSIFDLLPSDLQEKLTEENRKFQAKIEEQKEISRILVTSGYSFEGYRIVKYSGYISGDDATLVQKHVSMVNYGSGAISGIASAVKNSGRAKDDRDNFENFAQNTTDAFVKIRRQALKELKEAAYDLDCNAVIGVDFDYVTIDTEYDHVDYSLVCVTANGTACVIEPVSDGFDNFNDVYVSKDGKIIKD